MFFVKIRIIQINQKSEPITDWYKVRISTVWCGKWDLNPYVIDTRPSNVPVCRFQHCRKKLAVSNISNIDYFN